MAKNLFSVPIFFIVFRETLEAVIIISVLLGLVEHVADDHAATRSQDSDTSNPEESDNSQIQRRQLVRKLRLQVFLGAATGFFIALALGAAFIAVWFTKASDLWQKSEALWEGIFTLIASLMIFIMGVTMLKMERAKTKWRTKLQRAFDKQAATEADTEAKTGKWAIFILPFITVLREGMEAVVFVGGVALGQPATSIPIAAIVGIVAGLTCGWLLYQFASRATLRMFLITLTSFLLLIGAGLFSRSIGSFQQHAFNSLLGAEIDDAGGDGPGSYDVRGNVWHLNCCNPENKFGNQGWSVFNAIFGWNNNATIGTVLGYVFYWIAVMVTLVWMKFSEGRTRLFGWESEAGRKKRLWKEKESKEESKEESRENSREEVHLPSTRYET
ncbi:iron permease FTR1 [Marasmius fiardii PR-910]|nr:iron permease FTR1 [Marasmius fiardii PR-910]